MIINDHPLKGVGPERVLLAGSFDANAGANPVVLRGREFGFTFTVIYAPTGLFTITLPPGFTLPAQPGAIITTPQWDSTTNWFDVAVLGETSLITTTRQFVLQTHRSGTPQQVPANAGARVNFMLHVSNNTGK